MIAAHPNEPICTWETACRCGAQYCRSGWPAGAPLPADLPDPLPFLYAKRSEARSAPAPAPVGDLICEVTLPGLPESVRQFRALARQASSTPYQAEAAALCVSELVTNAILHSRSGKPGGSVTLAIHAALRPGELRFSVADDGGTPWGAAGPVEPGPSNGYGLGIVDAVAAEWAVILAGGRSLTWCEIPAVAL